METEIHSIFNEPMLWILGIQVLVMICITAVFIYDHFYMRKEIRKRLLKSTKSASKSERADMAKDHHNFLKSACEAQHNWLSFWIAFLGIIMAIIAILVPFINWNWIKERDEKFDQMKISNDSWFRERNAEFRFISTRNDAWFKDRDEKFERMKAANADWFKNRDEEVKTFKTSYEQRERALNRQERELENHIRVSKEEIANYIRDSKVDMKNASDKAVTTASRLSALERRIEAKFGSLEDFRKNSNPPADGQKAEK